MQRRDSVDAYTVRAGRSGPAFFVHVITKFDNRTNAPFSHGIDVGGNMRGCVRITVNVPDATLLRDERFGGFEESKKDAFISFVGYNRKCSLRDDLPSGDGTRHMIRVAMAFVLTNFTWVETFSLVDASHVLCTETGQVIDLSHLSLMTTGKTYYERYLGARLKRPEARVAYARDVAALSAADAKLDFDTFCRAYNVPHPVAVYMQAAYAASRTYLEFFRALRAACARKPPPSCDNVERVLSDNGQFVVAHLDGDVVRARLRENDGVYAGKIDGRVVWKIARKYTEGTVANSTGDVVGVYVETIGHAMDEYLVSHKDLCAFLLVHGIEEVESSMFDPASYRPSHSKSAMTPSELNYSSLHRMSMFQKKVK